MAKYLSRNCPRCNGYVGIVLREPGRNTSLQSVNGQCLGCGYRSLGSWFEGNATLRGDWNVSVGSANGNRIVTARVSLG